MGWFVGVCAVVKRDSAKVFVSTEVEKTSVRTLLDNITFLRKHTAADLRVGPRRRGSFDPYAGDNVGNYMPFNGPVLSPMDSMGNPTLFTMETSRLAIGVSSGYLM